MHHKENCIKDNKYISVCKLHNMWIINTFSFHHRFVEHTFLHSRFVMWLLNKILSCRQRTSCLDRFFAVQDESLWEMHTNIKIQKRLYVFRARIATMEKKRQFTFFVLIHDYGFHLFKTNDMMQYEQWYITILYAHWAQRRSSFFSCFKQRTAHYMQNIYKYRKNTYEQCW